jgi:hypothetical protein
MIFYNTRAMMGPMDVTRVPVFATKKMIVSRVGVPLGIGAVLDATTRPHRLAAAMAAVRMSHQQVGLTFALLLQLPPL